MSTDSKCELRLRCPQALHLPEDQLIYSCGLLTGWQFLQRPTASLVELDRKVDNVMARPGVFPVPETRNVIPTLTIKIRKQKVKIRTYGVAGKLLGDSQTSLCNVSTLHLILESTSGLSRTTTKSSPKRRTRQLTTLSSRDYTRKMGVKVSKTVLLLGVNVSKTQHATP